MLTGIDKSARTVNVDAERIHGRPTALLGRVDRQYVLTGLGIVSDVLTVDVNHVVRPVEHQRGPADRTGRVRTFGHPRRTHDPTLADLTLD